MRAFLVVRMHHYTMTIIERNSVFLHFLLHLSYIIEYDMTFLYSTCLLYQSTYLSRLFTLSMLKGTLVDVSYENPYLIEYVLNICLTIIYWTFLIHSISIFESERMWSYLMSLYTTTVTTISMLRIST